MTKRDFTTIAAYLLMTMAAPSLAETARRPVAPPEPKAVAGRAATTPPRARPKPRVAPRPASDAHERSERTERPHGERDDPSEERDDDRA